MRLSQMIDELRSSKRRTVQRLRGLQAWPQAKDDFIRELDRRLQELLQKVHLVLRAASRESGDGQRELLDKLTSLRWRTQQQRRALDVYQQEDGHSWDHFRARAEERSAELQRELVAATEQYRESLPSRPSQAAKAPDKDA